MAMKRNREPLSIDRRVFEILDLARWAPSGDNTQPWRFEPTGRFSLRVNGFDTREHCVYDLDGRPSRLSIGAMLETLRIAASLFGMWAEVRRDRSAPEAAPVFDVHLVPDPAASPHPLAGFIKSRSVQRRPLSTRPLSASEKHALETAVGAGFRVHWYEAPAVRSRFARLMFRSAGIRLSIEEAYRVHASVIEWSARESLDRIPDAAVGLDPISLVAMRWAMKSWPRTRFVSRYLGGTLPPRLQLDLLPAIFCAGHVIIAAENDSSGLDARLDADFEAGAAIQRFWLTVESLGLLHQPELTPLVFSRYAAEGRRFTRDDAAQREAMRVRDALAGLIGEDLLRRAVWVGRVGAGRRARARSLRLPLEALMVKRVKD